MEKHFNCRFQRQKGNICEHSVFWRTGTLDFMHSVRQVAKLNFPYANGDKVTHNEKKWVSDVGSNVWEPGVYGWSEYTEPVAAQEAAEDAGEATEG